MSDSTSRFGLSAALTTPFDGEDRIDHARLAAHATRCFASGCDSVTLFGTTGEGASIGAVERERVFGAAAGAGIPGERLVTAISATAAADAIAQGRAAASVGCRALLLPPPFYFKAVADDALFAWFASVIRPLQAIGAPPVILYNIPALTGAALSTDLIGRLRQAFGAMILGVKDSSGDWSNSLALLEAHRDIAILIGDERHLAAAVRLGGQGAISGLANLHPAALRGMAYDGGDGPAISRLVELATRKPVVASIKTLLAHALGDPAWAAMRPPLTALTSDEAADLIRAVEALGLATDA